MMKNSLKLTLILSVACNAAIAAQGVAVGPFRIMPEVGLTLGYDDNITYANTQQEVSSFLVKLSPQVKLQSKQQGSLYNINAGLDIGRYTSSSADNYEDFRLSGDAKWQLARDIGFGLKAGYNRGHDPRGETDRDGSIPNTWDNMGINALFSYGQKARLNFEGGLGYTIKTYDQFSATRKVDDFDQMNLVAKMFYRVLPKTRVFLEATHQMIDYDITQVGPLQRDGDTTNLSVGVTWKATAKTTGSAQLGYLMRNFDAETNDDFSGVNWKVAVDWKPVTRANVNISTARYTAEATGVGYYMLTRDLTVKGSYEWMPRISTSLGVTIANTDYEGSTNNRVDDTLTYDLGANYDLEQWSTKISGGVKLADRDSDNATLNDEIDDYDRSYFYLNVTAAY